MKTILIILAIIGLLKLVSLFIMIVIEVRFLFRPKGYIEIEKDYGLYRTDKLYIIPTIGISKTGKFFEISAYWLYTEYYAAYNLKYEEDE